MKRFLFFLICIFLLVNTGLYSQESFSDESSDPTQALPSYLDMEIRSSTLMELAQWARSLGLSEGGTRDELSERIRDFYGMEHRTETDSGEQRIITIEAASTTEYFTISAVDEEYARLSGGVIISLKDGDTVHRIEAWEILFNRSRNVLSATGGVVYIREEGDTIETFRGESITVNLDNWSSLFLDGASERSVAGNTTAYRFAGTLISRNEDGVTVLTDAVISNANNEDALWSLHAKKLWLLPGNDWAIFNAVLRVGHIPVLYLPFFYYPTDEIVFHPVLGFRSREGTFLQTTTYILGRPSSGTVTENSLTRIFGNVPDDMERTLEGIFLRSTGQRVTASNDTRLSLLFDAYVNLGIYLGTELVLPAGGVLRNFSLSFGIGFTRDVYDRDRLGNPFGAFTPFPDLDGSSRWNSGSLFSLWTPFRYRLEISGSLALGRGTLSWSLPFYSDPFVNRDFMNRTEALDWLSMLRSVGDNSANQMDRTIQSYEWRISGSYSFDTRNYAPHINSLSISNFSSNLIFGRRDIPNYQINASVPNPGSAFFFPNRFTLFSVSASMAGNPYRSNRTTTPPPAGNRPAALEDIVFDSILGGIPISPWSDSENMSESLPNESGNLASNLVDEYNLSPPVLLQRFVLPVTGGPVLSIDYRFTPSTAADLQFRSTQTNWPTQNDINWSEVSTVLYRLRGDGNLSFNLSQFGSNVYSGTLRLDGTGSWQNFLYLNRNSEEFQGPGGIPSDARIQEARNRTYRETFFTSSYNFTGTVRPFTGSEIWGNSNFQYNITGLLARTTVDTSTSSPSWQLNFGGFNRTDIRSHQVSANFAANLRDNIQNLNITAVIPPRDSMVSAEATIRAGISVTRISGRVRNPFDSEHMIVDPIHLTETLTFRNINGSFRQNFVYNPDPDINGFTTITSDLRLGGFSTVFSAAHARPYRYVGGSEIWELQADPVLAPRELSFGFAHNFQPLLSASGRVSFSIDVNTNLIFDLQRYTRTRLNFTMGFRFGITNFLEARFSINSENNVMFRYLQDLPFFNLPDRLYPGQQTNIFVDLLNSFRFDNEALRRSSGFKLRSLTFTLVHFLGDWNASLSITTAPYLDRNTLPHVYRFTSVITFLIQWIPIEEFRTQIDYSRDRFSIN